MRTIKHILVVLVMRRRPNTSMPPAATSAGRASRLLAGVRAALKAPMRAGGIGLLLIGGCGLSLGGLYALDRLQDPHKDEVREQIEYARQNAQLRRCLAQDPLVLDVTAVPSEPSRMIVAYRPTGTTAAADGASAAPRVFKAVSLKEFAASAPSFTSDDTKFQQRVELCRSVWAAKADERTVPWLRAHVLEPGSSLNAALRLLRLLAIGLLAACSIELLLRLLSWAKLPVASFKDIAKAQEEKSPSPNSTDERPRHFPTPPLGLARIIGTTLVTGVTGTTVLVPEMLHQFSWRERSEWRQDIDRHIEKTNLFDRGYTYIERAPKPDDGRIAADLLQATGRLDSLQQRLETTLQRVADGAPSAKQWQALEQLAEKGIAPVRTVADPKGLDGVRQSLAEVRQAVEGVKPGIDRSLETFDIRAATRITELDTKVRTATDRTKQQLDDLSGLTRRVDSTAAHADRLAAGLLGYADDVESRRWFFRMEARYRRCMLLLADDATRIHPPCGEFAGLIRQLQPQPATRSAEQTAGAEGLRTLP